MSRSSALIFTVVLLASCSVAQSPLDQIWRKVTTPSANTLSNDKITAGLKEALKVSTTKAVATTGRPDGFLKNEAIKILLPPKLQKARTGLRFIGMGPQLDQLEVGMNRAAEQAAPEAKQIFLNALMQMSIDDARHILSGNDTAATEYFRSKSSADLATAFQPIIHRSLQNVGVVQQYEQLKQNSLATPVLRSQKFDLDNYVVGKTLDGLFYMLGQEEKQIRKNPAAQTTTLLKEVFGSRLQ
jgi:Protein of unknown function (DUF4197)